MGLSIGEVAARAGAAASAIRYYEAEGLLPRAARESGRRVYDISILERMKLLMLMRKAGFPVALVKSMLESMDASDNLSDSWEELAIGRIKMLNEQIRNLTKLRDTLEKSLDCNCNSFDDCEIVAAK